MYITEEQKYLIKNFKTQVYKKPLTLKDLEKAISHAVNCKSIDAATNTPDWVLAEELAPLVLEHLFGITGEQLCEQMTKEEKAKFFGPENQGSIENFKG